MTRPEMPMQPIMLDATGVARFVKNRFVRHLYDAAAKGERCTMNDLLVASGNGEWTQSELEQFLGLIGYSVAGFAEHYCDPGSGGVRDSSVAKADAIVKKLKKAKGKK